MLRPRRPLPRRRPAILPPLPPTYIMDPLDLHQIEQIYLEDKMRRQRNDIWRARKELDRLKAIYAELKAQKKALTDRRANDEHQD